MTNNLPVSILLADDHRIVQDGIRLLLKGAADMQVVAAVSDGKAALDFLKSNTVDLLLTDVSMPDMNGIELTRAVKEKHPDTRVLILSMHSDAGTVSEAVQAEADGYLLKNTGREELLKALRKVMDGGTYYSADLIPVLMNGIKSETTRAKNIRTLTDREIEILRLVCEELTTQEIADQLFISPKTVETHRKNILRKTGVRSVIGLMKYALVNRLVDIPH